MWERGQDHLSRMSMATGPSRRKTDDLGPASTDRSCSGRGRFVGIELGERLVDLGDDAAFPAGSFLVGGHRARIARRLLGHSDTERGIDDQPLRERDGLQPR